MTNIKSEVSNISIHNAYEPPVVNKETEKNQTSEMTKHASITDAPAPNVINISINGPKRFKFFGLGGKCYSIPIPFTNKTRTHNVLLPTDPKIHTSHDVTAEHIDVNLGASLHPSNNNQKLKIGIIGCGGTIAGKAASNTESASYKPGDATVRDIIENCNVPKDINISQTVDAFQMDSVDMSDKNRLELLNVHIQAMIDNPDVDSIVITHGTDSLEETAYFLNLTAKTDKPIVLVASMRPGSHDSTDGRPNMRDALRVAENSLAKGRGILTVLNNKIFDARGLFKDATEDVAAFDRSHRVGHIDGNQVGFYCKGSERKHTQASEFDVSQMNTLPNVQRISSDTPPDVIDAYIKNGTIGFVVDALVTGTSPETYIVVLSKQQMTVILLSVQNLVRREL
ncbi:MAG: asparaginase domain-containing protein [Exilibacterium sp.]